MSRAKSVKTNRSRKASQLFAISDEMKEWSTMLAAEVAAWPRVRSKAMFGLVSFYHNRKIFAAIPRTRAVASPYSIILKFHADNAETRRARRQLGGYPAMRWLAFQLHSERDVHAALKWLDLAYRMAR